MIKSKAIFETMGIRYCWLFHDFLPMWKRRSM